LSGASQGEKNNEKMLEVRSPRVAALRETNECKVERRNLQKNPAATIQKDFLKDERKVLPDVKQEAKKGITTTSDQDRWTIISLHTSAWDFKADGEKRKKEPNKEWEELYTKS